MGRFSTVAPLLILCLLLVFISGQGHSDSPSSNTLDPWTEEYLDLELERGVHYKIDDRFPEPLVSVRQDLIPIFSLKKQIERSPHGSEERTTAQKKLDAIIAHRKHLDQSIEAIVQALAGDHDVSTLLTRELDEVIAHDKHMDQSMTALVQSLADDDDKRALLATKLDEVISHGKKLDMEAIVHAWAGDDDASKILTPKIGQPSDSKCWGPMMEAYTSHCGSLMTYGEKDYTHVFRNLCSIGVQPKQFDQTCARICATAPKFD